MEDSDNSQNRPQNSLHSHIDSMGKFHYRKGRSLSDCVGNYSELDIEDIYKSIKDTKFYDNIWEQRYQISGLTKNSHGEILVIANLDNGKEKRERIDLLLNNLVVD